MAICRVVALICSLSTALAFMPQRNLLLPMHAHHLLSTPLEWSGVLCSRVGQTALRAKETAEEEALRRGGGRGTKGLYVRPSKALEIGGGFYVPGLEGYRLRLAIVGLILTLLTLNRVLLPGYNPLASQVVSETITVLTALFVLLQALFDATFKGGGGSEQGNVAPVSTDGSYDGKAAVMGGGVNAAGVYVDPNASEVQRDWLQWQVSAAMQTVPASCGALVVGTRSRVAAAGAAASIPSASQVEEVLAWALGNVGAGVVTVIDRGQGAAPPPPPPVFDALLPSVAQALVAVSQEGDVVLFVALKTSRPPQADGNEEAWLKTLVQMPV